MSVQTSVNADFSKNYDGTVRSDRFGVIYDTGKLMTPDTTEVLVKRVDENYYVTEASGTTVPTGEAGYAKGAKFVDTDASGNGVYFNEGDHTAASWALSDAVSVSNIPNAEITDAKLASAIVKDNGSQAVGYFDFTGTTSDTEVLDINGRTYEFDTNGAITGDVAVDVSGGASATQSATAFVAALNADASRTVDGIDVGDGTVILVRRTEDATMPTLDASGAANVVASGAALVVGATEAVKTSHRFVRAITAQDVTTTTGTNGVIPIGAIPSTSVPSVFLVQVRSANGVIKACANVRWSWAQANSNFMVLQALETQAAATDFASGDTVSVLVSQ